MDGILLADKPKGKTSHDVVDAVRRDLGVRGVGHAGTLDPLATGLLVLGVVTGAASAAISRTGALNPKQLPLGDGKYTTTGPKKGYVYSCGPHTGGGGAQANGPWIHV